MEFSGNSTRLRNGRNVRKIFTRVFFNSFDHGHTLPRRCQFDFPIKVSNLRRPVQFYSQFGNELFRNMNNIFQITVRLIQFNRRKFRVVTRIDAFVPEAAVHFIYAFETADEKPLQVQFRCNTQVYIHIKRIVMRNKRTRGNIMEHRGFHFKEIFLIEIFANTLDNTRTHDESLCNFRIYDEVEIPLSVSCFFICKAMKFFRQRAERFGKERPFFYAYRNFTGMRREYVTLYADDIPYIEKFKEFIRFFPDDIFTEIELNFTAQIAEYAESGFTVTAQGHKTACQTHMCAVLCQGFRIILYVPRMMIPLIFLAERVYAGFGKLSHFFTADYHLIV